MCKDEDLWDSMISSLSCRRRRRRRRRLFHDSSSIIIVLFVLSNMLFLNHAHDTVVI
jgi:hypothetical protein